MSFTRHRTTRPIRLGGLRLDLREGEEIEVSGNRVRVAGREHVDSTIPTVVSEGWLVPVREQDDRLESTPLLPALRGASLPAVGLTDPAEVATVLAAAAPYEADVRGLAAAGVLVERGATQEQVEAKLPYLHPEARERAGKRPAPNQAHVWDDHWLNNPAGTKTCKVCGVTERQDLVRADIRRGNGKQLYHYTDVLGRTVSTFRQLSCPTFIGVDAASGVVETKEIAREAKWAAEEVGDRVGVLEEQVLRLAAENETLRAALLDRPTVDATAVAAELLRLVEERAAATRVLPAPGQGPLALPAPTVDDVIDVESLMGRERVPVNREEGG